MIGGNATQPKGAIKIKREIKIKIKWGGSCLVATPGTIRMLH